MHLRSNGTSILGDGPHARHREAIDPRRTQAVLIATGYRPEVAQEAAYGELSSSAARRLGTRVGLIEEETR